MGDAQTQGQPPADDEQPSAATGDEESPAEQPAAPDTDGGSMQPDTKYQE